VPPAMDEQLVASIKAVGIIQPPCVTQKDDGLTIVVGNRRVKAAIAAELPAIDVMVWDADEAADAMRSVAENLIRASMSSVDIWRAIERLEAQGWNEQAIADALALPLRTVRRLKLLAHLHPAMLDVMALGSMPNEEQLRTIATATREEQAQVWKKHRPKKGQTDIAWHEVARALAKRRMPASAAQFGDDLAKAYGIVWEDDLFAPPGEDSRYTTEVEAFFGAQQEWLQNNLPGAARSCRSTTTAAANCRRRPNAFTASPARPIWLDISSMHARARCRPSPIGCPSRRGAASPRAAPRIQTMPLAAKEARTRRIARSRASGQT
jgi:ParB family chromosome partitioning protein